MTVIDDHLVRFDLPQRAALDSTAAQIRKLLPGAEETISYRIPTFTIGGIAVVGIEGFSAHNSLFPFGELIEELSADLTGHVLTKGGIHFPFDQPFPAALLRRIIRRKVELINAEFPKKNGEVREFYDNGFLKMEGRERDGAMHGPWRWYRRDGTLMRSGSFTAGKQTGLWTTYDRTAGTVKETDFG
jgi:uncharacterized protein YdhG (YjbR/CyaY superfamily)